MGVGSRMGVTCGRLFCDIAAGRARQRSRAKGIKHLKLKDCRGSIGGGWGVGGLGGVGGGGGGGREGGNGERNVH